MSKIYPKFEARRVQDKLLMEPHTEDLFHGYIKTLPEKVEVVVRPWKEEKGRSSQQNRYYFGVIVRILSEETGYTVDEIHELLKFKFLRRVLPIKDKEYITAKSTTELDTTSMEEYFSHIRQWASIELGCYIPLPNEVDYNAT